MVYAELSVPYDRIEDLEARSHCLMNNESRGASEFTPLHLRFGVFWLNQRYRQTARWMISDRKR
jgi:hypothetical protein